MPIGSRQSTSLSRDYIYDERLNSLRDSLAREAFFRAKLLCDNCGRLPGNPGTLGGLLFPLNPPKPAAMEKVIKAWAEAGLVFHYQGGGNAWAIEICDHGAKQRLVGNMAATSDLPAPPLVMIEQYEKSFGIKWKRIEPSSNRTNKSERVQTPSAQVQTCASGQDRSGQEGSGGDRSGPDRSGNDDLPVCQKDYFDHVTLDRFDLEKAKASEEYSKWGSFGRVVVETYRQYGKPERLEDAECLMTKITDRCNSEGFKTPASFHRVLCDIRRELKTEE